MIIGIYKRAKRDKIMADEYQQKNKNVVKVLVSLIKFRVINYNLC